MIPEIETARLRLRAHTNDDFSPATAMWADPQVTKFITGRASSAQQTWSRILAYLGHWQLMNYGYWAFEEKASGEYVGEGGFADFKRDLPDNLSVGPEVGFAFIPRVHGQGYASEVVQELVRWGDRNLQAHATMCIVSPDNAASLRVVDKAGYRIFDDRPFNEQRTLFLSRTRLTT